VIKRRHLIVRTPTGAFSASVFTSAGWLMGMGEGAKNAKERAMFATVSRRSFGRIPFARTFVVTTVLVLLLMLATQPASADQISRRDVMPQQYAKSHLVQDPAFMVLKLARARLDAALAPLDPDLSTTNTQYVIEPEGGTPTNDLDDTSPTRASYGDAHYWQFCTAGAVSAALAYWPGTNVFSWPAGSFTEPSYVNVDYRVTTYWTASDTDGLSPYYTTKARSHLMYIAEQVSPPSFVSPGEVSFDTTGWGAYGTLVDMRDALNWEASGHNFGNWSTYFYGSWDNQFTNFNQSDLHTAIVADISTWSRPAIVVTKTSALPTWTNGTVVHAVAIVGYDDTAGTYTYLDTCGVRCGSSSNGGVHTVNQTNLYNGIKNVGNGGGIVW
jgi:hypothetical protein